jgi:hypothetical protein
MLKVDSDAISALTKEGMTDIAHLLRPAHLEQLANILKDDEASDNDKVSGGGGWGGVAVTCLEDDDTRLWRRRLLRLQVAATMITT